MRADGRHAGLAGLLAAALFGAAGPARAQVYGTAQFQYQNADDVRTDVLADGTRVLRRIRTEALLKSIDMRHQAYLRQNLVMDANLRFSEQTRPGEADRVRTPSGTLRLLHPSFQLTAQHQPTTVRSSTTGVGSSAVADTSGAVTTTRNAETQIIGNAVAPGGLTFNGAWRSRRRDGQAGRPGERSELRNLRAGLDRERYSVYATAGDQRQKTDGSGVARGKQGQYSLGGSWRPLYSSRASTTLQYDLAKSRTEPGGGFVRRTTTQTAQFLGEWRPSARWSGTSTYSWRRAEVDATNRLATTDQEGQAIARWAPVTPVSLSAGGGFRTQRDFEGRPRLLEYATAIVSGDGRVRQGWTANGSATHTTTWDPDRGTFGTQTLTGISRMALGSRASLDATLSIAANGDTAAASQRWSNVWTTRLQAQPYRSLRLTAGLRSQRVGPGLLSPLSVSRGVSFDAVWRPHPALESIGTYSVNEALTGPAGRTTTWSANSRLQLARRWQLQGLWSRTATPRLERGVESILTQDLASGRLLWQPTRWVAASASYSSTDPGKVSESRRFDGTFTWSFGR